MRFIRDSDILIVLYTITKIQHSCCKYEYITAKLSIVDILRCNFDCIKRSIVVHTLVHVLYILEQM